MNRLLVVAIATSLLSLVSCSEPPLTAETPSSQAPAETVPEASAAGQQLPEPTPPADPPPLVVELTPLGDTLLTGRLAVFRVDVTGGPAGARVIRGTFGGKRVAATPFDESGRRFLALAPVDIDDERRELELHLDITLSDDTPVIVKRPFGIEEATYETSELSVNRRYVSPSKAQRRRAARERAAIRKALTTVTEERLWRGSFRRPTETQETSPFGTKRTLNGKKQSRHLGWDLDGKTGDPILASQRGRAVVVDDLFYSGGTVILDHGQGLFTLYFHMSAFDVKEGALVEKGQLLGKVGKTGRVTGPHLHFAVKLDDTYLDPKQVLSLDLSGDPLEEPAALLATPASLSP